jgi:ABC-type sugar transport system ATPase subunit
MAFLESTGLTKRFGGLLALDGIDLEFLPGEIHSIIGENGAGKSTFLKILSGIVRADAGDIFFEGRRITHFRPNQLSTLGISAAIQETSLFENLTVTENLYVGNLYRQRSPVVNWKAANVQARQILADFGWPGIDPQALVGDLTAEDRQILEILKAVKANARVISLDEPTASLTQAGVRQLFALLQRLKQAGITILYVSHHLNEVLEISDRISVFRDGRKVGTVIKDQATEKLLHEMMIGRAIMHEQRTVAPAHDTTPLLQVNGLTDGSKVQGVSFEVRKGELLGITGLVGAGRSELAWLLFGLMPKTGGSVHFEGADISRISPEEAIRRGIFYLPEDRRKMGLFLTQDLPFNTSIARLDRVRRGFIIDSQTEASLTSKMLERMGVKYSSSAQWALNLSGGNQQKLMLGKGLFGEPKLLILDEPTRGIDVGSKEDIYQLIRQLADEGMTVIFISSEVEEVCRLTQRVLVMGEGKIIGSFTGDEINENRITACYLQTGQTA